MKNHWLRKHLRKTSDVLDIQDNFRPISLTWEDEYFGEQPVLRADYVDLQTVWTMHTAEVELQERNEKWDRFLMHALTISELLPT
jgi:hypothetical protein